MRERSSGAPYDLVAVKNGEPDKLFDAAMEALGGMGRFVRPNQTVVVKPNIAWDVEPERAANTNPLLVRRIVEQCRAAGAKTVYVFDNTCDNWRRSYKSSGIEQAVRDAGGTLVSGESERYYQPVKVGGQRLTEAKEHELILESDVFINVPVLKDHGGATLTVVHEEPDGHHLGPPLLAPQRPAPVHRGLRGLPPAGPERGGRLSGPRPQRTPGRLGAGRHARCARS